MRGYLVFKLEQSKKLCLFSVLLSLVKKIQEAREEMAPDLNEWETVVFCWICFDNVSKGGGLMN